jgi:hypothetical protein
VLPNEQHVNAEIENLKRNLEHLQTSMDTLLEFSRNNQNGLNVLRDMVKDDHAMLLGHQKILVIGNGEPSLMENFRTLNRTLSDFITNVKEERDRREKKEALELLEKKQEITRWRWAIIGIVLPVITGFAYQFFVFWTTIAPKIQVLP